MFHIYGRRLANILQKAIDEFCYKSLPQDYDLEIDGLVYIGEIGSQKQAVYKLRRNLRPGNKYESNHESVDIKYDEDCKTNKCFTAVVDNGLREDSKSPSEFHKNDNSSNVNCLNMPLGFSIKIEGSETDDKISKLKTEADSTNPDDSISSYISPNDFVLPTTNNDEPECESSKEESNKIYKCCKSTWHGFHSYEKHYVSKHLRYPCPLCSQSFTSKNNMRRHVNCNHGEKRRFECSICEKLFTRPDIVKEHKLTHTKSYRENRCSQCQFVSNKKTILLMHLKKCLRYENIDHDIFEGPQVPLDFSSRFGQVK